MVAGFKAGLRAKQIDELRWSIATDATGELADALSLPQFYGKGQR
jgi:hypothetical protein